MDLKTDFRGDTCERRWPEHSESTMNCFGMCRKDDDEPLVMTYFPLAARGELPKMLAVLGGVKLTIADVGLGPHKEVGPALDPPLPATVPILKHGDMTIYESLGIETYICNLSPKFAALTPKQKAIDDMYSNIKEDIMQQIAVWIFAEDKSKVKEELTPKLKKMYAICEGLCPEKGFINGLSFPTKGDLAVLLMMKGFIPYGWAFKNTGWEAKDVCPKMVRIAEAVAEFDGIREYLAKPGCTMFADPGL